MKPFLRPLVLIDGSSYLYRAYHALPPLTNSKGEPSQAIKGVANMLLRALKEWGDGPIAVVMDAKGPTFRDEIYAQYKSHRPPMPDDLRVQVEPTLQLIEALGFPLLQIPGVEADDVIGTLATAAGECVLISTGDKDLSQLVNDRVHLINTMTNIRLDATGVLQKYGVRPDQFVDFLGLVGDTSDNIPGVPKVGEKTAIKWLATYQSVDELLKNQDEIGGKVGESLRAHIADLELSRTLARIKTDLDLPVTLTELTLKPRNTEALRALYQRFEFNALLNGLDSASTSTAPTAAAPSVAAAPSQAPSAPNAPAAAPAASTASGETHAETVLTEAQLSQWLGRLEQAAVFAFDTETTGLDYFESKIVGVSIATTEGHAAYIPLRHQYPGAPAQLSPDRVLASLKPYLESPNKVKVLHHAKFDEHMLVSAGLSLQRPWEDTMLQSYVLNSVAVRHNMDTVVDHYLGLTSISFESIAGKGAKQLTFDQIDLETATRYAGQDADYTLRLYHHFQQALNQDPVRHKLYDTLERPVSAVLWEMERNGVTIDVGFLSRLSQEFGERLVAIEREAVSLAGEPFNLDSPKQLQHILFTKMGIKPLRKTPTGQPSTAEDVLAELAEEHELPKLITQHRELAKLKSTYTEALVKLIHPTTGRIHTHYHQATTITGRLSSSNPNLQNIPIRTPEGRRIRQAFIAPEGHTIVAADYSQIELRIMAHLSQDANLLRAFSHNHDIHASTAADMFGVELESVSSAQRRAAKAINFGLMYGMQAFGLAKRLEVSRSEAQSYIDQYFERFSGVRRYMEDIKAFAHQHGYVETVEGRRLYLPDLASKNRSLSQYAERAAINAPMQGTAADIIKHAMIAVSDYLRATKAPGRLVMQVHDELVFEVANEAAAEVAAHIKHHMERVNPLSVPLIVEVGTGNNWDEAH